MKIISLVLLLVLFGCKEKVYEKPWVVYEKRPRIGYVDYCCYWYRSSNNHKHAFSDRCDKYSVGDTIR